MFEKTSKLPHPPDSSEHGLYRIFSSYCLAHCQNLPKCCNILVWIAECWNSSIILLISHPPKNNCWLSHIFGVLFGRKLIHPVCQRSRRIRWVFEWSGPEVWSLFKYSRLKLKNQKPIAVDVLFKAYPMVPLSCRYYLAGRYIYVSLLHSSFLSKEAASATTR